MTDATKNVEYYLSLPYGVALRKDNEGDWIARVEELPGCTAHGSSGVEALENIAEVQRAWLEDAIDAGDTIPEPHPTEGLPSGKWLQRVPRSLHKRLVEMARVEGVSLNQLTTSILAEALGKRYEVVKMFTHTDAMDVLWPSLQGSFKADWNVCQVKNFEVGTELLDALSANVSNLPNKFGFDKIPQFDWKGSGRAQKKDFAPKA